MKIVYSRAMPGRLILSYFAYVLHTLHEDVAPQESPEGSFYCILHTFSEDLALWKNPQRAHSIACQITMFCVLVVKKLHSRKIPGGFIRSYFIYTYIHMYICVLHSYNEDVAFVKSLLILLPF